MNTYLMKKAMIEAAVSRGIKDMEEDPKRSIRRLCDLGKQFSKNRFQDLVFSVMQELLNNEDSQYYDMMHNLLQNSDHEAMKKFGVNFGYMSWTYGAATIRKEEREVGYCIPWTILLDYRQDGYGQGQMAKLVEEGQDLGIFAYFIRETGESPESYELLELLERYKDCAFVWIRKTGRLTAAQIQMLKVCKNTVVSLPIEDPESLLTAALLRDQKIIFAMHTEYDDAVSNEDVSKIMENVLTSQTALFFMVSKPGTSAESIEKARKGCTASRLEQKYPCVMMDYRGDGQYISGILCEHRNLLEIDDSGHVVLPDGSKGKAFPFDRPLSEGLREIMPAFVPPAEEQ